MAKVPRQDAKVEPWAIGALGALLVFAAGAFGCDVRQQVLVDRTMDANLRPITDTRPPGGYVEAGFDFGTSVPGCACTASYEPRRCAGKIVEVCVAGHWISERGCLGGETCVLGSCRGVAEGCPDAAALTSLSGGTGALLRALEAPVPVGDCMAGGDLGRHVSYAETQHDVRSRSVAIVGGVVGCADPVGALKDAGTTLDQLFGVSVAAAVTSADLASSSGQILAGSYGQFYRQAHRIERIAKLTRQGSTVGLAVLTDWTWTVELATGNACPPPSSLPGAMESGVCLHQQDGCQVCTY